ncbi:hypothetical protein KBC03_04475 [Patescibacteria group bacterium]|nr:hypothetical protein [Patescibacteria group bacterium]
MENAVKAQSPLLIKQETRNLPGVKAKFVNTVKAINNAYISTAINIFAKKKGWDEATKQTKGEEIKKNFIAQMPSDEEFTQQYDELIHSISYITNETKKSGEESAAQWNNPRFNSNKIERYVEQAEDLYYIVAETDKPSYGADANVDFPKETFGTNDADLPFDQMNKRAAKVVEVRGGEKITYYFSRSRVQKTEENTSGYIYNIERVSKNERVLLQVISSSQKEGARGRYE